MYDESLHGETIGLKSLGWEHSDGFVFTKVINGEEVKLSLEPVDAIVGNDRSVPVSTINIIVGDDAITVNSLTNVLELAENEA